MARLFVGEQNVVTGGSNNERGGFYGQAITDSLMPRYGEQLLRGRCYVYHVASQALLLAATTGGHPTIFNPLGSGYVWIPLNLTLGFISGTTVVSGVVWRQTASAGTAAATGSPILTATLVTPQNALLGGGVAAHVLWSPTTNTFTAAPAAFCSAGINLGVADPSVGGLLTKEYNGEWGVYPGNAISLCLTVTTSTAVFQISIFGMEVPLIA